MVSLVRFGRVWSGCSGLTSGCALSGQGDSAWSALVRFGRGCSGCSGLASAWALSGRGHPAWSALVRFGRGWSGCSGLASAWALSGRGHLTWSGLVRFGRGWSGCSGLASRRALSGRGDSAWSGLVRFGRGCSGCVAPVRWLRTDIGRSLVLCGGATVSRCGVRRSETAVGGALMGWVYGQLSWEERCAIARLRAKTARRGRPYVASHHAHTDNATIRSCQL